MISVNGVSEKVLNYLNGYVFNKLNLAYVYIGHDLVIQECSDNWSDYGFSALQLGEDISTAVEFFVGVDTSQRLSLPIVETPSGQSVTVTMIPDSEGMTVTVLDATRKKEYRSRLQQAANENELLVNKQAELMAELKAASEKLSFKNQQLNDANRLQTSFLSGVSHEFRTPLTSIIGYTELVSDNLSSEEITTELKACENVEHLRAANRSSKHLLSLVENLLDHGKLDSNEVVVRPKPIDLFEVFDDVAILLKPICEAKDIELVFKDNFKSPLYIFIDDSRLRQCLINLIGNAVKFTDQGRVSIESKWDADMLYVSIVDTGIGIENKDLEKVRLPFWQVAGTGKAGTGLGLTITERIIELMGGDLEISSVLGQGTTVNFNLSAAKVDSLEDDVVPDLPKDFKILLAEDDTDIADLTVMLLDESGVDVTHAQNGAIAIDLLESEKFDLVLMDLNMPVMNGYQAIEALREGNNSVPIVVMSASTLEDDSHPVGSVDCDAYLVKPVGVDDILRVASQFVS